MTGRIAACAGMTGLLVLAGARGGCAADRADRLVVRTYDEFGVTSAAMARGLDTATAILAGAGIEAVWRGCGDRSRAVTGCDAPVRAEEVVARIVTAPPAVPAEALGTSLIDLCAGAGTLATIYGDRIDAIARRAGVDDGRLLGRALAHEIGHMLLGTARHSDAGLMRARWTDAELRRETPLDWAWSPREVVEMHRRLEARISSWRRVREPSDAIQSVLPRRACNASQ